jgi:phosphate transport system substrate-binding protein
VKIQSRRQLASLTGAALVGTIALSGCGSDNNASASGTNAATSTDCVAGTLNGEGSSAQKNAIDQAATDFQETCKVASVNYNPTGSGAGIKQFIAGQVDFAGSDSALKDKAKAGSTSVEQADADTFCGSPAWNLPMVTGPIAVAYNVKGVDKLILTPSVTAKIFSGTITTWNDPAIAAINKGVTLPAQAVKVFFRSDESGTTENFTTYLSAAAAQDWPTEPAKKWSGKGEGKEKSAGVAGAVKSTEGGVTYAEWSYARDSKLAIAQIDNGSGPVELTGAAVGKAVSAAKQVGEGNNLALKLDYATKEAGAYPILLVTYEIVCSKGKDPAKAKLTKAFLKSFAAADMQTKLQGIGYAPLPTEIQAKVTTAIDALS